MTGISDFDVFMSGVENLFREANLDFCFDRDKVREFWTKPPAGHTTPEKVFSAILMDVKLKDFQKDSGGDHDNGNHRDSQSDPISPTE